MITTFFLKNFAMQLRTASVSRIQTLISDDDYNMSRVYIYKKQRLFVLSDCKFITRVPDLNVVLFAGV